MIRYTKFKRLNEQHHEKQNRKVSELDEHEVKQESQPWQSSHYEQPLIAADFNDSST